MTDNAVVLKSFLTRHSGGHERVAEMLMLSIGRLIWKAEGDDTAKILAAVRRHEQAMRHVADWFKSAVLENASWLANVDEHGRPKKLMKYGSLERIFAEADKVMIRKSRGLGRRQLGEGAEEVIATLEDGYSIVRMLTREALDAESAEMQHCIGHGSYDEYLEAGSRTTLLSLRDRNGRAHATAEIADGRIVQVRGKQNEAPADKYLRLLVGYFAGQKFDFGGFGEGVEGWVACVDGSVHRCDSLPDTLHVPGDLTLQGSLPKEIVARGDVYLRVDEGDTPPRSVKAGGDIHIIGKGFNVLPKIETGGELLLDSTGIRHLPEGLHVKGLFVAGTPLQSLPENIKIEGRLVLHTTKVASLPPSLWKWEGTTARSHDTVDLTGSPVSCLGGINVVQGALLIGSTAMKALPHDLLVEGRMDISMTAIRDIPSGVKVNGDLRIMNANVRFRSDEVLVGGSLDIRHSTVRFPKAVRCGRAFSARDSNITMPESLECVGDISIEDAKIDQYPKRMKARHVWFYKVTPSGFLNRLAKFICDLETKHISLPDQRLKIGDGVKAPSVLVYDRAGAAVRMTVEQARQYLGKHKRFARRGGLTGFAESIAETVGKRPVHHGEMLFFASEASLGRRIVYDEFHRSVA
ncbi:PcfJ domain-containing protein [Pararhizobium sp. BT-229]|uniref:PcfJ domain-containing protein n=1 Tax=Pararhizobium sp. BT-229 TaxID=2986923 RepID=UPI0021F6BA06|nr:PcfJ domain-containing protein [Pararhizobium sp. BT-229]MCV9964145.1 PcfJ domain-containing protein [Pararhizobium sp. BT-229]